MDFKICIPGEIRYDIANYNILNDEQKNLLWINELQTPYNNGTLAEKVLMKHASMLVKSYIEATEDEKTILWIVYDDLSRKYSDFDKWKGIEIKKKIVKEYLQKAYPDADENFYDYMVKKYI